MVLLSVFDALNIYVDMYAEAYIIQAQSMNDEKHKLLKQFCNFSFVSRPGVLREKTLRKCLQKQQGGKDENCKLSPNKQCS